MAIAECSVTYSFAVFCIRLEGWTLTFSQPGRGVGFVKRNLAGLGGNRGLGLGQPTSGLAGTAGDLVRLPSCSPDIFKLTRLLILDGRLRCSWRKSLCFSSEEERSLKCQL